MKSASGRLWRASPLTYGALVLALLLSVYPFYYMFIIATRTLDAINDIPPPFTPGSAFGDNLGRVLDNEQVNFLEGLLNSLIVCTIVTFSAVFTSTLAGFAFAKLQFKGRNLLLVATLATMMIPT